MTEGIAVAIITTMGLVIVALISAVIAPLLLSIRRHAKTAATQSSLANDQVSNDHTTNLRVENDQRHSENVSRLTRVERTLAAQGRGIRRIEQHLGIEDTITTRRKKP